MYYGNEKEKAKFEHVTEMLNNMCEYDDFLDWLESEQFELKMVGKDCYTMAFANGMHWGATDYALDITPNGVMMEHSGLRQKLELDWDAEYALYEVAENVYWC